MNVTEAYVNEVLHVIERDRAASPHDMRRWRAEWRQFHAPAHRAVFAWLGDRLIGLGERLQDWSLATPRAALSE